MAGLLQDQSVCRGGGKQGKRKERKLGGTKVRGAPPAYFHAEVQKTGEELLNEIFKDDEGEGK